MFFRERETGRLLLKNISFEDRDFIYNHFSDETTSRYLFDMEPFIDLQDADKIINQYIQPEPRKQHRWIIVTKACGAKIGTCGFHNWDKTNGCCEVGYDLCPGFWGKGYMREALQDIFAFAKKDMKIKKIDACIYTENNQSLRLAEKLGFVFNGQMKDEVFGGHNYQHKLLTLDYTKNLST